jgi:hypothetical protein
LIYLKHCYYNPIAGYNVIRHRKTNLYNS